MRGVLTDIVREKFSDYARKNQVTANTGFESPCSTKGESLRFSPLETPSALCPPQKAGFTLNLMSTKKNLSGPDIV